MKKQAFAVCLVVLGLFLVTGAFGQEGFTGPGGGTQAELVTAAAAANLRDDARVTLQGTIARSLGREKYVFKDSSGEITIEIDRRVWRGLSVGENDRVEIYGEVDRDRRGTEIEVRTITKL